MNLHKATGTIGGLTMVSRIAGFAREMLMSRVMGASWQADAFFVVRLWMEREGEDGFRARILRKIDSASIEYTSAVAGTKAEACDIVREWVDEFVNAN